MDTWSWQRCHILDSFQYCTGSILCHIFKQVCNFCSFCNSGFEKGADRVSVSLREKGKTQERDLVNMHPLKAARQQQGWSRATLAGILGVSVQTVMRWEQGRTLPYPYYREQLCHLFGKNIRELGLLPREHSDASGTLSA